MANIFSQLFGSKFPSTEKYENKNKYLREDLARYQKLEKSDTISRYTELDTLVNSGEFKQQATKLKKEKFKDTEAYHQFKLYKEHKRSSNVKRYYKCLKKGKSEEAEELKTSTELQNFLGLKKYIESEEYASIKAEMSDKNRFKKSKEFQLQEEYKTLCKSEDVVWFLKTRDNNPFKNINKWKLTFEDNFDGTKLDESKWITGYFWGKALLNDNYVQANEKQFFKQENVELRDSCARIVTKNESSKGKAWDPQLGFVPKDFDFTSGIISTGQSFRQQYGKFEAKIKFNHIAPAMHTFGLLSEQMTPQVNILKTPENTNKKFEAGNFWGKNGQLSHSTQNIKIPGSCQDFFIYTLDWSKDKMVWKINGVPVYTITENVPQEPMYISLSTHFLSEPKEEKLPISMDIDWVRCYQLN